MADSSYPTPANGRLITEPQYERLMASLQSSGLVGSPSLPALAYADGSGMLVKIRGSRAAYVRGRYWDSGTTDFSIAIPANSTGAVRSDLIVLGLNRTTWNVTCYRKAGSTTPPALTVDQGPTGTYEIPIAQVNVPAAASSISSGHVVPLAWYLGASPIVCTATTLPPVTVGGLTVQVATAVVSGVTRTTTVMYVGAPSEAGPVWQPLVSSGTAPLGTYVQYLGDDATGVPAPTTHPAMAHTAVNVLPSRYVRISARAAVRPNVAASGQIDIVISGTVFASSGRKPCLYTGNDTVLNAEFFFRTAPNQTQVFVASNVLVYDGASDTTWAIRGVHLNVVDHGPYSAAGS